ncbi:polyprenyl synthetase family protein [Streptantibioticus cattleyicolor]|uniref:Heptaprenyl diphosphate synthase component II n=1 Tax=Streptantibioticus cattleyicolor (strain ATCC 35852 / DSM 46488 / JCM 4925 / NBRC 14057 / NRRL 8057) TaxID=1003195 RepID=F8JL21_STREN|nr:polyprenyl synthetase family protein [Streptantibioticus cattleyicolor]AEW98400.1 heptaprenyl diphosphate synthase component II [Streptantibioticus cattleyicolor NRRL 8057 = DSM 46488]CCB72541.1 IS element protein [Streptantibioticus cattleyicolor NRRL 8057 = DSM 46488]
MLILDTTAPAEDVTGALWTDLLADDLPRFEAFLEQALAPQREYLTDGERALYRHGKRLRPAVLLLAARMVHGAAPLPDKVLQGAVSLEMLHVATLIHDDIVDGSALRRGLPSVNAARGTGTAVLVGDLQFVQAIRGFVRAIDRDSDMGLVELVLDTAFQIGCGELDELRTDLTEDPVRLAETYWRTADRKTAALFGLAAEAGVTLADGHTGDARRAGFYGRRIGRALQVMDDLFDLAQDESASGKPRGMDLLRRRASLPLIYAMREWGPDHAVSRIMRGEPVAPGVLDRVLAKVRGGTGFSRAYTDARTQVLEAVELLRPFPAGRYRYALEDLALHIVDRGV